MMVRRASAWHRARMTTRAPIPGSVRSPTSTRSRAASGCRSPTSRRHRRTPSVSCPNDGRDAFTSCRSSATEHELLIATADPLDVDCERTLGFATGRHVRLALADARRDRRAHRRGLSRRRRGPASPSRCSRCSTSTTTTRPRRRRRARTAARRSITLLVDELLAGGIAGAGERHPHRAGRAGHRRSASRRRRARARAHAAARRRAGARVAHQDPLGARHRRSAAAAGRPRARRDERRRGRSARLDAAGVARREGRHPRARRPVDGARRSRAWAFTPTSSSASSDCCNRAKD